MNVVYIILLVSSFIKLISLAKILPRENYETPSTMLEKVEKGEDPEQLANEACENTEREKIALEKTEDESEMDLIPEVSPDVQAEEIEEAEEAFYGMARHARSGNLLQVRMEKEQGGSLISDNDGWIRRTTEGGKLAMLKEDLESSDNAFSRNYALWKCYKNANCKGTIYSRDGSMFALYSDFNLNGKSQPTVGLSDPGIPGKKGKGKFTTKRGSVTLEQDLQPKTSKNSEEDADGGNFDIHILDSPERIAAEKEAANMREATSGWKKKHSDALSEATTFCTNENPATDWNKFTCVITGCSKKNTNNGKKNKCSAQPRTVL